MQAKMELMKKENEQLRKSLSHIVGEYDVLEARVKALRAKPRIDEVGHVDLGLSALSVRKLAH